MECFLQYLDSLDDLFGAAGLVWERFRRALINIVSTALVLATAAGAISLALAHVPIAMATSIVLFVVLMYRSVTSPALNSFA